MTTPVQTEKTINCPRCGHRNLWPARFCSECGAWIVGVSPASATTGHEAHNAGESAIERSHRSPVFYFWVFLALGVLTVLELAVTGVALDWFKYATLGLLAALKVALVAMFFMHLRGDRRLYGLIFIWPVIVAVSIVLALGLLFRLI